MTPNKSIEIFFSYSHADEELRQKLVNHLINLERNGHITAWHDREISAGTVSADEIEKHLNSADVILLLISADFIASEDSWQREVKRAMEKHEAKEARVIPVLVRDCDWEETPFSRLRPLPSNGKAIDSWDNKDEAFTDVAKGIRKAVQEISGQKKSDSTKNQWLFKIPWRSLRTTLSTSIGITTLVVLTRLSGVLEPVELPFFDQMMRSKSPERQDDRLLLIQMTPEDFTKFGSGTVNSLPDKVIYDLLTTLITKKPKAIGFDLYREQAAEKGSPLESFLRNTPNNFYAVCKVLSPDSGSQGNYPPPEVNFKQIGFSDLAEDPGNVVRRQLLYMGIQDIKDNPCSDGQKSMDSLSLKLAQHYLRTIGKEYKKTKDGNLASGDVVLKRLYGVTAGGYRYTQRIRGYQVLLNYRSVCISEISSLAPCSPRNIAPEKSVQKVLEYPNNDLHQSPTNKLKEDEVKDKIVLIGVQREGIDSLSPTPFSLGVKNEPPMPGLIMQAQMISQLVSAVEQKRSLLQVWSIWYEMPWILFWSLLGGIQAEFFYVTSSRNLMRNLILSAVSVLASLYVVCWILFTQIMFWIPLVPAALSFLGTVGVIIFIRFRLQKFS